MIIELFGDKCVDRCISLFTQYHTPLDNEIMEVEIEELFFNPKLGNRSKL